MGFSMPLGMTLEQMLKAMGQDQPSQKPVAEAEPAKPSPIKPRRKPESET
jgi:hypothetical protein